MIKRFILTVSAILMSLALWAQDAYNPLGSQNAFKPLDSWPYLFEEFKPGNILDYSRNEFSIDELNINVIDGKLHFVKDDKIMVSDMRLSFVVIDGVEYMNVGGQMAEVLLRNEGGMVVKTTRIDVEQRSKADIGYNKSALATTHGASLALMEGSASINQSIHNILNQSIFSIRENKGKGVEVPLKEITYLYRKGMLTIAAKPYVMKMSGVDVAALKNFIKTEKIRFKDVEDLGKLLEFLK